MRRCSSQLNAPLCFGRWMIRCVCLTCTIAVITIFQAKKLCIKAILPTSKNQEQACFPYRCSVHWNAHQTSRPTVFRTLFDDFFALGKKLHRLCSVVGCIERMQRRTSLLRNSAAINTGDPPWGFPWWFLIDNSIHKFLLWRSLPLICQRLTAPDSWYTGLFSSHDGRLHVWNKTVVELASCYVNVLARNSNCLWCFPSLVVFAVVSPSLPVRCILIADSGVTSRWARVAKHSWRGSITDKISKKCWEMVVNPDVDIYTKTRNHRKTFWKRKETTYWKPKEY